MDDLLETAARCPHCRASVRPGAPWCTLCHADLRPPPAPAQAPAPALQPAVAPVTTSAAPVEAPAPRLGEPTWPCTTCGAGNPIAANACTACGAGFLAGLREADGPLLEIPGVGDITRMSRGQRMLIAFGVAFVLIALMALLSFL